MNTTATEAFKIANLTATTDPRTGNLQAHLAATGRIIRVTEEDGTFTVYALTTSGLIEGQLQASGAFANATTLAHLISAAAIA